MEKTEAYTNKILKATGKYAKFTCLSFETVSVIINLSVTVANPTPITIGRTITDIICIPLNYTPYVGVGLSIGLSLYNNNGYLDDYYLYLYYVRPDPLRGW
jgi:hypothetical protein